MNWTADTSPIEDEGIFPMANLLIMNDIWKAYGTKTLFSGISLGINEGEKIGLVGKNGVGKSTLLKLIAGIEDADRGETAMMKQLRIQYLAQNPVYAAQDSVIESVLSGDLPAMNAWRRYHRLMKKTASEQESFQRELSHVSQDMDRLNAWGLESEAQNILTRLGIRQFDTPMEELSGGQRKRTALTAALMNPADLLILDEPTNHLDNDAIDWLEKYLQRFTGALLMVTHDRYFLERVANRIIEIDNGALFSYDGNYDNYVARRLEREESLTASENKRQALLRKELAWIQKGAKARTTKQKARIERFEKLNEAAPSAKTGTVQLSSAASRLGKKTVMLEDVGHSYGAEKLIDGFSLIVARDERLGIVGPNGIGKSTLLGILGGFISPAEGIVDKGSTVKIGYFPQESRDLPGQMKVIDYIREGAEYLQVGKKTVSASQMLENFLFSGSAQHTAMNRLSGGELRRLHLLRIIMESPNVLLLDEPGNDLDIETLSILEDYLDDFEGAVIAVSHDRYFLDRITERIAAFEGEGRITVYPGNYNDYVSQRTVREEANRTTQPQIVTESKNQREAEKARPLKFTFKEQKEYEEIDGRIAAMEDSLQILNRRIEDAASDYQLLQELLGVREMAEAELDAMLERWTYLTERAEEIEQQRRVRNSDK